MATVNELVMSPEAIQAELANDSDVDVTDADDQVNPELESDGDFSNWEDESSDVNDALGEDGEGAAAAQPQLRKFKANGREVDVDMGDQEGVDRLITLGLGARPLFSKVDKLTKDLAAASKKAESGQRYEKMWKKLDSMKSDHDALYEAVFGRKYDEAFKERKEWSDRFESASPEQQNVMLEQRRIQQEGLKLKREREEWESTKGEGESKLEQAERKEFRAQLLPEFYKHEFSSKVKDGARAEKLNAVLWKTTISNLKGYGEDVEITPELIRKEFRETAALLAGDAKAEAKQEVKKVVEQKKKVSQQQAKVASTRNYGGAGDKDLGKEKDPVKLLRRMFGR